MRTLFILRHAKSDWGDADLSDFERPLNRRGLDTAPLMGGLIKENSFQPSLIISSPAERAAQTTRLIEQTAEISGEIKFDKRIYEATAAELLEIIREQKPENETLMLVGHNPGLENLIKVLTGDIATMPTAALAIIDLQINDWSEINSLTGNLRKLIRPKEMTK